MAGKQVCLEMETHMPRIWSAVPQNGEGVDSRRYVFVFRKEVPPETCGNVFFSWAAL